MDRPIKRIKISDPEMRPSHTGSKMTEGLYTSELGIQGDDTDHHRASIVALPTRTINLSDFQRRAIFNEEGGQPRPALSQKKAGIYLLPRAPDATVTANVVEINVNDGTTVSTATVVPVSTAATVVSVEDVGSLTVPGVSSNTAVSGSTQSTATPPALASALSTITSDLSPAASVLSAALNSTSTGTLSTVTVTATSTFEISYINGTIRTTGTLNNTRLGHHSSTREITSSATDDVPSGIGGTYSSTFATATATYNGYDVPGAITSSTTSSGSAATSSSTGSGNGVTLTPAQQQVVGGVVGGVAGIAIVLLILLVILRWYRRRLKARGELPEQIAQRNLGGGSGFGQSMSQRSSGVPFAAAIASSLRKWRPLSSQTDATTGTAFSASTVPESERGFQRIAGRKIAPVLTAGGDGYGGSYGAFEKDASAGPADPLNRSPRVLSGASFYQDGSGLSGGKGAPSPTFPSSPTVAAAGAQSGYGLAPGTSRPVGFDNRNTSQVSLPSSRPEGKAVLRPSPARTPVTQSPAASSVRLPIQQPLILGEDAPPLPTMGLGLAVPMSRDGIGRSLASQDGSRVSGRSRSSARSRFAEDIS